MAKRLDYQKQARSSRICRNGYEPISLEDRTLPLYQGNERFAEYERRSCSVWVSPLVTKQEPLEVAEAAIRAGEALKAQMRRKKCLGRLMRRKKSNKKN